MGPWSLSMGLNRPSPVLFAQDMPQEAKTTVGVCPPRDAFPNTPDSCVLRRPRTPCSSACLYVRPMDRRRRLGDSGVLVGGSTQECSREIEMPTICEMLRAVAGSAVGLPFNAENSR